MALITAAEARELLPGLTGTAEDALLGTLISAAGAAIARYLGYPVALSGEVTAESASYTLYLDGPGGRDLVVPVWPLTAVASIYDDPDLDFEAATLVASAGYAVVEGQRGLVRLKSTSAHGAWSTTPGAIKVACTAGYATAPSWLKQAAKLTVRHMYDGRQTQGKTSQSIAGGSIGLVTPSALPVEARELLDAHILPAAVIG